MVVDPDRMVLDRHAHDTLAIARNLMQSRSDVAPDQLDIDPAARSGKRRRVEDHHAGDVHMRLRTFEIEKSPIQDTEPFVIRHRALPQSGDAAVIAGKPRR